MNEQFEALGLRLAFRPDKGLWKAYAAEVGTMEGAVLLGFIPLWKVEESPGCKQAFIDQMQRVLDQMIRDILGGRPIWGGPTAVGPKE